MDKSILPFSSFGIRELCSDDGVSDSNIECLSQGSWEEAGNSKSCLQHDCIAYFSIPWHRENSSFGDLCVSHEHTISWDANFIKSCESIILHTERDFRANVTYSNSWKRLSCFRISNRHQKGMHTIILACKCVIRIK